MTDDAKLFGDLFGAMYEMEQAMERVAKFVESVARCKHCNKMTDQKLLLSKLGTDSASKLRPFLCPKHQKMMEDILKGE